MFLDDVKLSKLFTIFSGIPRRCFRALFARNGESYELDAIKDAIDEIEKHLHARTGPTPFKTPTSDILLRIEPTDGKWGHSATEWLSKYVAELVHEKFRLRGSMTI